MTSLLPVMTNMDTRKRAGKNLLENPSYEFGSLGVWDKAPVPRESGLLGRATG